MTPPTASVVLKNATNITLAEDIQIEVFHGGTHNLSNGTYTPNILNFTITGGTVTLGAARITFRGNGNSSVSFTATGSTEALNTALDAATYTSTPNLSGTDVAAISFTCYYGDPYFDDQYEVQGWEPDLPLGLSNVASVTFSIEDSALSSTDIISKITITNVLGKTVFKSNYDNLESSIKINV